MTSSTTMDARPSHEELLALATDAAHHAYAPYSEFPVGAAFVTADGDIFSGCNVENAAYPLTICAERNAVTTMIAQTSAAADETAPTTTSPDARRIDTIAIVGLKAAPCWPCGACRQVLREFGCSTVVVAGEDGAPVSLSFDELLPHSFGPEHLAH